MISRTSIFLLLGFLILVAANLGVGVVWAIAAVSFVALVVLLFAMRRQGDFRGPGVLLEDAREKRVRARLAEREQEGDVLYVKEEE